MGALKTEHFFSKCGGDKGKKQKKKKSTYFFVDRSDSEPLTSHYHLGPTPARVCNYHHYPLENRIVCKFKIRSDQKSLVLERVFCSCVTSLKGGWGGGKKLTSPLMGSWWCHITTHRFFGLQVKQLPWALIGYFALRGGGWSFSLLSLLLLD